ncbi:hypothetical protein AOC36_05220 [Erysipelothrix larvae]|uniref:Peptidase M16 C-terminal domain-containing protein n=1 Tax=Erysipelothrix larvae TaxID=1514105 RepID=A0A0X8GZP4_9FIRM|nr:pitrilysin family protein [Erysipelothrix larvae]AMC93399.1 hypothetical protein AOC36_05220 [Erysipelothrix larvae]
MFNLNQIVGEPNIWLIPDSKFNEVSVNLLIKFPLTKETATTANVLTKMLSDRLSAYPSKQEMAKHLDWLYGTSLSVFTYSLGQAQILEINTRSINKRYVEEDLLNEQFKLVYEVLLNPLLNEETFKEAKLNVKKDLLRVKENPQYFALLEALSKAGPDQICGIQPDGNLERLECVTLEDVHSFHQMCVHEFEKTIYVVGDVSPSDIPTIPTLSQTQTQESLVSNQILNEHQVDYQPSNQTELVMIYQTDITPHHELYLPYLVFIALLGQGTSSLLFQNVREKHSLCYSIYASQLIFDGLFYISTSISPSNEAKVIDLVSEQIEAIKRAPHDLAKTKAYLVNQISGTTEKLRRLGQFVVRNHALNRDDSPEDMIESIMNVTPESVQAVVDHINHSFIYSYRGQDDETN